MTSLSGAVANNFGGSEVLRAETESPILPGPNLLSFEAKWGLQRLASSSDVLDGRRDTDPVQTGAGFRGADSPSPTCSISGPLNLKA